MPEYFEVNLDGSTEIGPQFLKFNASTIVENTLVSLGWNVEKQQSNPLIVYKITKGEETFILNCHISKIHNQEEGRDPNEKRIQLPAGRTNLLYNYQENETNLGLVLGVYKREDYEDEIICAWPLSAIPSPGTQDSLRLKTNIIAYAMVNSVGFFRNNMNELIYAFCPQMLEYYIRNKTSLHENPITNEELTHLSEIYGEYDRNEITDNQVLEIIRAQKWMIEKNEIEISYDINNICLKLQNTVFISRSVRIIKEYLIAFNTIFLKNGLNTNNLIEIYETDLSNSLNVRVMDIYNQYIQQDDEFEPFIPETSSQDEYSSRSASITGNEAEKYFELEYAPSNNLIVENKTGVVGLGYDFQSIEPEKYFEIKGCRENIESIRFTKKEWMVARVKGDLYCLVIIYNLNNNEKDVLIINNPYERFRDVISPPVITKSITYHLKKVYIY